MITRAVCRLRGISIEVPELRKGELAMDTRALVKICLGITERIGKGPVFPVIFFLKSFKVSPGKLSLFDQK
jgi:hypothetical protein